MGDGRLAPPVVRISHSTLFESINYGQGASWSKWAYRFGHHVLIRKSRSSLAFVLLLGRLVLLWRRKRDGIRC